MPLIWSKGLKDHADRPRIQFERFLDHDSREPHTPVLLISGVRGPSKLTRLNPDFFPDSCGGARMVAAGGGFLPDRRLLGS